MKRLLPLLPRPTRYLGSEWGTVHKDISKVRAHIALCFPDLYEVGMSYLGQKILYDIVNRHPDFYGERGYVPCEETAAILKEHGELLATMESDTPLKDVDVIGVSMTHELCYTNVLYMLELSGIPLRSADRGEEFPLVIAGGGACFNAEPMADFLDAMMLGDGEESIIRVLETVADCKEKGLDRQATLKALSKLPGLYIPAFFDPENPDDTLIEKAVVDDLNPIPFPQGQVLSFGQAVHDRLTLEIARGCTRGCRFCQAGIIYRPVRERTPEKLHNILMNGLKETGYEETSFLSLSTGDYSALDGLFATSFDHCAAEQVSISLPSLRVGSISDHIMKRISSIRRTGATLAPEAGSQRMRDVINKGITEPEILDHVLKLFNNGWQSVKLYFMIGLPTETFEDLDAILDLCLKVRDVAGKSVKRLNITAAVSPFVPKSHTPFQWDRQITIDEISERLDYLRSIFKPNKRLQLKFHQPQMSFLEGIFSRGDRRLGNVLESAYKKGAIFSSWKDHLDLKPYIQAMDEFGLTAEEFQRERSHDERLPWDHLSCGVSKKFLLTERRRSLEEKVTPDCRYDTCRNCGICQFKGRHSLLEKQAEEKDIRPRMVFKTRDQADENVPEFIPAEKPELGLKGSHFRLWFEKMGPTAYLSQLDLQSVLERAMRRAELPLSFSEGFHPMPRISFGKALPVGVESSCEWLNIMLRTAIDADELIKRLNSQMPIGLNIVKADTLTLSRKHPQPQVEEYTMTYFNDNETVRKWMENWHDFLGKETFPVERKTKKGTKIVDIRKTVRSISFDGDLTVKIMFDWSELYFNPIKFMDAVCPGSSLLDFRLVKTQQKFE
ncbi:TIGR03960 family B12-binding radical SAM protein [Maridesulfovibrio bastinii]|uniref:TIGR03960 family B12-binding radical SAM protein n=1 Tax=Maridesulfovibrio bastinii TaxID=47157 RepID=UPI0003F5DFFF|nr:TIGR03960 family B12-binding radical SAM protein [Maridesulfovibrio bastinii]